MKRRFLLPLALLLLAAMLLPCPVIAEDLSLVNASAVDEINNPNVDLQPEELPEFQLDAPDADDSDTEHTAVETAVMAAPADESNVESASADVPKAAVPTKLTLGVKEKYALKVSGAKKYASSNKQIATVSNKGVIQGKKTGTAKITITYKSGKKTTVKVTIKAAPGKVTLNKKKATLNAGKKLQLKATLPGKTASCKMTWSSSNKKVAKVDTKGKVTALKAGTAKITVTTFNGKKATCTVTVKKSSKLSINAKRITLEEGEETSVIVTGDPEIDWICETDNEEVCIADWGDNIDETHFYLNIEAIAAGTATVTIMDEDTGEKASLKVTVKTSTLFIGNTSISVDAGFRTSVTITYLGDNDLCWTVGNPDIATCRWKDGWNGDDCDLYIIGLSQGTTVVTIYDEETDEAVDVYITVSGVIEKSTDLLSILRRDIPVASIILDRNLTHYKENAYYDGGNIMATVDNDGLICQIGFFNDVGNYKLCGLWPGQNLKKAVQLLLNAGWELIKEEDSTGYFTNDILPQYILSLKYSSGSVSYIVLTM